MSWWTGQAKRKPRLEELEPRILYSADLLPSVDGPDAGVPPAEHRTLAADGEFDSGQFTDLGQSRREVVFVDPAVPDAASLIDALRAQRAEGAAFEVVMLDAGLDGIGQISQTLAQRSDVAAVHLLGHGADGELRLGTSVLDAQSLQAREAEIAGWGGALTWDADLLIYGCDVAQGEQGRALVDGLARITGADVAASDDLTGAAALGGDWNLEYANGAVDPSVALHDPAQSAWLGLLDAAPEATPAPGEVGVAATPLAFERNIGQTDASVDFLARGSGYAVWLAQGDALIALDNADGGHVVRLDLVGANPTPAASGEGELSQRSNYLVGSEEQWLQGVENYSAVRYDEVYAGVDVRYYGNGHQLEYDFVVHAGADAGAIRLGFDGTQSQSIDAEGNLILTLDEAGRTLSFHAPLAYQDGPAGRETVASRYVIYDDGSVGFELGPYDTSRALVIDPILAYGTYLGGSGGEQIWNMETDAAGNVYVTGYTTSADFPTSTGAYSGARGNQDVLVSKFSPDLSTLLYSTYVGGSGSENGYGIAVDSGGNAYVTGATKSSNFPVAGAYQSAMSGSQDVFVFKLNASGSALVYSTLLGGSGSADTGYGIAVDAAGNAYVAGYTDSSDFPVTAGALDTTYESGEAFVAKLDASGGALVYSTFLGGSRDETIYNVAVDAAGNAVVVGETSSSAFSVALPGAFQASNGSSGSKYDAFVAKLNASGTGLLYGSFVGGSQDDFGYGLALDATGRIYISGDTSSNNFDVTSGAMQAARTGGAEGFAAVFDPALSGSASLVYSTYIGGTGTESFWGIDVDAAGRVYLAGYTTSSNLTVTGDAYQSVNAGGEDIYVVVFDPNGGGAADRVYASYLGGANAEDVWGARFTNNKFYVAGNAASASGITTAGAYDTSFNGGFDGYVAAFSFATPPVVTLTGGALAYAENSGPVPVDASLAVTDSDSATLAGATVRISGNYVNGEDVLAFNNANAWGITGTWAAATGTLTLTGASSVANYQAALRAVTYDNTSEVPSTLTRSVTFTASDAGSTSAPVVRQIAVSSLNDAPVNTIPAAQSGIEDTPLVFSAGNGNAITVGDVDAGASLLQVTLTAANGQLTLAQTAGLSFTIGDGTDDLVMTLTGTVANINAALDGLRFDPAPDYAGTGSVQLVTNDLGNSGAGGAQIDSDTVTIGLSAVNDAPVQSVPGAQATPQNVPLVFSSPTGNAITLTDVDAGGGVLQVTLSATNGSLTLGSTAGLGSMAGDGSGSVTMTGTLAALNAALDGLRFTPALSYSGAATLTVATDDQGNSGAGGSASDTDVISITVSPNIAPILTTSAAALTYVEGAGAVPVHSTLTVSDPDTALLDHAGVRILGGYLQGEERLVFVNQSGIVGSWDDATGTLTLTGAASPTDYQTALRTVTYLNTSENPTGTRSVAVVVSDGLADSGAVTRAISLEAQNDAPAIAAPVSQSVAEDTPLIFSLANGNHIAISDPDAGTAAVRVTLTASTGTLTLLQTTGLSFAAGANGSASMSVQGSADDINVALSALRFDPAAHFAGAASVQIAVDDLGNSGSGGAQTDTHTIGIAVTAVNDPPKGTDGSVTTSEDSAYVFSVADFGFSDPNDSPGADLLAVRISLLPGGGTLTNNGAPVSAGSFVSAADIAAGRLVFTPFAEASGVPYAALGFQLQDTGGTAGGGIDLDPVVRTLTINVAAVNDAPVISAPGGQTTSYATALVFSSANGNAVMVSDIDQGGGALSVTLTATNGTLTLATTAGLIGLGGNGSGAITFTAASSDANDALEGLIFTPNAAFAGSAMVQIVVDDLGNTGGPGPLTDSASISVGVLSPNLSPVVTPTTLTVVENAANGTAVGVALATDPDPAKSFSKLYWTDYFDNRIVRSNLDGSGSQTLVSGLSGDPVAIAVDHRGGRLYWTNTATNEIWRSNLDGSGAQVFIATGLVTPTALEVDSAGGTLYWTDLGNSTIQRVNLDGTGRTTLLSSANGLSAPAGIDLDVAGGKMYWVDDGTNRVQRANLDGTNVETLVTGLSQPGSIALDVANNKLYWADPGTGRIGRANLDGTSAQANFISVSGGINELAIDTVRGKLYWTEDDFERIRSANLDGSGVTTVLTTGLLLLSDPSGIALGPSVPGLSYAITGGNTGGAFAIDAVSGAITVANGAALDFESSPSYTLTIQVTDAGGMVSTGAVTVNLLNANEAPSAVSLAGGAVNEATDTSSGLVVGTLGTTDVDAGDTHTYTIAGGTDAAKFSIAGSQLILTDGVLDFETQSSYQVTVRSVDAGGLTANQTFTVSVGNLPDAPTVTAVADQAVNEDSGGVTVAFTIGDQDTALGSLILTAASSNTAIVPAGGLALAGTGANRTLTVTPAANAYGAVTITLSVSDGTGMAQETFTLTVNPVADHLLVVDTVGDAADGDTSSIDALLLNRGADGRISLREAILAANATSNGATPDRIEFDIAGAGPHTIDVLYALPTITDAVIIDARTEPDFAGTPMVELNGAAAGAGVDGLRITAGNSTVRGLVINRFSAAGIYLSGGDGNIVQGNYLGLDPTGNLGLGNGTYGIRVASDSNLIGGGSAAERNVISGSGIDGVRVESSTGNLIRGNYIGTNASGTAAIANAEDGIWLDSASNTVIGGTTAGARNLLSGNGWAGIGITGGGTGNVILGNYIGVDASGTAALANGTSGVTIYGSNGTVVGGTAAGAGNLIAYNGEAGVAIGGGVDHAVLGNTMYGNGGLAIDLGNDGVTVNDAGDTDLGTNQGMNAPVIYSVAVAAGNVTVTGEARPGAYLEFFQAAPDASGHGEGRTFLGAGTVSGPMPGALDPTACRFTFTFAAGALAVGDAVTATATDATGSTSEFAQNVVATASAPGILVTPVAGLTTSEDGGAASFSVVLLTQPTADVLIALSSSDPTEGTAGVATLTFTSGDWNVAQVVTVTGVGDLVTDGAVAYSIVLGSAASADLAYAGIDPADVALINTDGLNDPPLIAGPGAQATAEDAALVFSVANGNAISVSDPDVGPGALLVTLSAGQGTLTLSTVSGLTFVSGDGSADASMTFTGTLAAVNAALDGLAFAPLPDFWGAASLSVAIDDQGGSGSGGPQSDSETITIGVAPMNDAPNGALVITGTPAEGQPLTADASGVSDPDGMGAIAYQWLRSSDGGASWSTITGATTPTYTLTAADVGTLIRVLANYVDGAGTGETVASASVGPVANVNDAPTGTVVIMGVAQEDQILTADTSAIADLDGLGPFGYAWQRSFDAGTTWTSTGVTALNFTLDDPDVGALVRVIVSYVDGHGTLETLTAATGPVAGVNDLPTLVANTGLTLAQGSSGAIGASQLRVADVDDTAAQLLFRLTGAPSSGALQLNGAALAVNGTFTQADVDAGRVRYVHAGGAASSDSFVFTAGDAAGASIGPVTFNISISVLPPPPPPPPPPIDTGSGSTGSGTGTGTSGTGSGSTSSGTGSTGSSTTSGSTGTGSTGSSTTSTASSSTLPTAGAAIAPVGAGIGDTGGTAVQNDAQSGSSSSASSSATVQKAVAGETRGSTLTARFNPSVAINFGFSMSEQSGTGPGGMSSLAPIGSGLSAGGLGAADQRALASYRGTLGNSDWVGELDRMREQVDNSIKVQSVVVGSSAAVTGTLSVGYVIWLLRGGLLVSSLLSSLPAWTAIDPLPVLGRTDQDDDESGGEADPLERLFGRAKEAIRLRREPAPAAATPMPEPAAFPQP